MIIYTIIVYNQYIIYILKGGENMRTYRNGDYYPRDENECIIIGQEGTINAVAWVVNAFLSRLNHESERLACIFLEYAKKENDIKLIETVKRLLNDQYAIESLSDSEIDGTKASPTGLFGVVFILISKLRHEARYLDLIMREFERINGSDYGVSLINILNDARSEYED